MYWAGIKIFISFSIKACKDGQRYDRSILKNLLCCLFKFI